MLIIEEIKTECIDDSYRKLLLENVSLLNYLEIMPSAPTDAKTKEKTDFKTALLSDTGRQSPSGIF
jgi:hypothetical protein